jgi:hypothetical protein
VSEGMAYERQDKARFAAQGRCKVGSGVDRLGERLCRNQKQCRRSARAREASGECRTAEITMESRQELRSIDVGDAREAKNKRPTGFWKTAAKGVALALIVRGAIHERKTLASPGHPAGSCCTTRALRHLSTWYPATTNTVSRLPSVPNCGLRELRGC